MMAGPSCFSTVPCLTFLGRPDASSNFFANINDLVFIDVNVTIAVKNAVVSISADADHWLASGNILKGGKLLFAFIWFAISWKSIERHQIVSKFKVARIRHRWHGAEND